MKTGLEKLEETEVSWETHAAADKFYDTTLAQYKTKVQRSRDVRALIANLEQQLSAAYNTKKAVDKENLELEKNIGRAISGDSRYGTDSDLYEGTGRVRTSERKTGLTRKKKDKPEE